MCSFIFSVPRSALNLTLLLRYSTHIFSVRPQSSPERKQELFLAPFLLTLHLATSAWAGASSHCNRADGISGGLQPTRMAVQFIPEDSLNDGRIKYSCLSSSFSLPVPPAFQPMQSHNDTGFSCAAVLHSYAQFSWPHGYVFLSSTILPAREFSFCVSECSLILQKAGGNVTSCFGIFSANLKIRTGFSGRTGFVFPYLSLLHSESAGTENSFFRFWKFPTAVKALW